MRLIALKTTAETNKAQISDLKDARNQSNKMAINLNQ